MHLCMSVKVIVHPIGAVLSDSGGTIADDSSKQGEVLYSREHVYIVHPMIPAYC